MPPCWVVRVCVGVCEREADDLQDADRVFVEWTQKQTHEARTVLNKRLHKNRKQKAKGDEDFANRKLN